MQADDVHFVVSKGFPVQYEPAPDGLGEVHDRVRCLNPSPQVTLQSPYDPQSDHAPFTPNEKDDK